MPSNKKKGPNKGSNDVKEISPKKKKVSVGWVFGMVVLLLIAVSFVAAPAITAVVGGSNSNEIVFGSYDGEKIVYSMDSYFYDQYQYYGRQYKSDVNTDSNLAQYQIWSQAFNSTVVYTAISEMADTVGIKSTEKTINDAIINSGYYNVDNMFNVETYNNTSADKKSSIRKEVVRAIPYQTVLNDVQSILTSTNEAKYVSAMADSTRSFKYVSFDYTSYPKELAAQYALTNPQLFSMIDLSVMSLSTEEEANAALIDIKGETTFEDQAIAVSIDGYASKGGAIGSIPYYAIKSNFKNIDESMSVLEASNNAIIGPFETENGWALYKVNSTAIAPDYTSEDTLNMIKTYIANNDSEIMDSYLNDQAKIFATTVADDFDAAAIDASLTVNDVTSTSKNIGNSQYMNNFTSSDTVGLLALAAADFDIMKLLFNQEVGTATTPIKSNNGYLVAFVSNEDSESGMGSYIEGAYSYYAGTHSQQDLQSAIMSSDKLENNFLSVFIDKIMANTTQAN